MPARAAQGPEETSLGIGRTPAHGRRLLALTAGALGIVYGDIGTSPLYALRECFLGTHRVAVNAANVLGILSLIFWSLIVVISIKYLIFVMRADNGGEGGILALMALTEPDRDHIRWVLLSLGLFGAALLYGDGMITPAISVLSAVEGLQVATPVFKPYVVPITLAVLIGLFLLQRRGTAGIGALFGPVMAVWFVVVATLGVSWIVRAPGVLAAANPLYAFRLFALDGRAGFLVLGSVFLVVTGGEALYADMGHFGRRPIRIAWFALVLPALLLNYFGQGALLLTDPSAAESPFYRLAPAWSLYPLVVLATVATVIASQAVISGAFSLTHQAIQLGYCPRIRTIHTSALEIGQIYIPSINWLLMLATLGLVLGFGESTRLAGAYGVAVTTTMVITTVLAYVVARERWKWSRLAAGFTMGCFLVMDLSFFAANIVKVPQGGWFPLLVAGLVYLLLSTWKRGRRLLSAALRDGSVPIVDFVRGLQPTDPPRVPGTAVFLTPSLDDTPSPLLHNLKHNKVLHERVVLLTLETRRVPRVAAEERVKITPLPKGFYQVRASYGFLQTPSAPDLFTCAKRKGLDLEMMKTTFFLGRATILPADRKGLSLWRKRLFSRMSRNAETFNEFLHIPPNRVVELGMQVNL